MKEIKINIDDEVYRRAKQRVADLESAVSKHVTDYLDSLNGGDDARARMAELFRATWIRCRRQTLSRRDA